MAATSSNEQLMANRPKPAAIPTGRQRVLAESGGRLAVTKYAVASMALCDPRIRPASKVWFGAFLWPYQPGRVFRKSALTIGAEVMLGKRTVERALAELRALGYIGRHEGGWVCVPVELRLDPEHRAWREQLAFDFAPPSKLPNKLAQYLGLRVVDNPKSEPPKQAVKTAQTGGKTAQMGGSIPVSTSNLPLKHPAHRVERSPHPADGSAQGSLDFETAALDAGRNLSQKEGA